jgi:hypothetical protein
LDEVVILSSIPAEAIAWTTLVAGCRQLAEPIGSNDAKARLHLSNELGVKVIF